MRKKIVIFGYAFWGAKLYKKLRASKEYDVIGFADNNHAKQSNMAIGMPIYSVRELNKLQDKVEFSVIIAAGAWAKIGLQLEKANISIEGIYNGEEILPYKQMYFEDLDLQKDIFLYAGDICDNKHLSQKYLYGLSITKGDAHHILHDITNKYPLPNESIAAYQAEDVLEHISYESVLPAIDEIYRILKKGSVFRICLPDYNSPFLKSMCMRNNNGEILYDPFGGGDYSEEGVINGGHQWFPSYDLMRDLLSKSRFEDIRFLCYYTQNSELVYHYIDDSNGYVNRIQDGEEIYSMVIDCYK